MEVEEANGDLIDQTVRFQCGATYSFGEEWVVVPRGVVETGELDRLTAGHNPVSTLLPYTSKEVSCARIWVPGPDNLAKGFANLESIVMQIRNMFNVILELASNDDYRQKVSNPEEFKDNFAELLSLLKYVAYVHSHSATDHTEQLADIISSLLLCQGQICDLPRAHRCYPACSDIFHAWLEVRWCLIVMTSYLSKSPSRPLLETNLDPEDKPSGWLEQLIYASLLDLAELTRYADNSQSSRGFACPCIQEAWFCLLSLAAFKEIDFWSLFGLMFTGKTVEAEDDCGYLVYQTLDQSGSLFWSLIGQVTNLVEISDCRINIVADRGAASNQKASPRVHWNKGHGLDRLLKKHLKQLLKEDLSEDKFREVLEVLQTVSRINGPSLDLLTEVWNYFASRLDKPMSSNSNSLVGAAFIPKSSLAWFGTVSELCEGGGRNLNDNYSTFLRMVASASQQWTRNNQKEKFGPRVLTKISVKKFMQFGEIGVYHTSTLMAILLQQTKQVSLAESMMGFVGGLLKQPGPSARLRHLCLLTKMLIGLCCFNAKLPLTTVGQSITDQIESLVDSYQKNQSDIDRKRTAQDAVKVYLEFIEDIFDNTSFSQGEDCLVGSWILNYLKLCPVNEISSIFNTFVDFLSRCHGILSRSSHDMDLEGMLKMIEKLDSILQPAIRTLLFTLTCPTQVVDAAFNLLLLLLMNQQSNHAAGSICKGSIKQVIQTHTDLSIKKEDLRVAFLKRLTQNPSILDQVVAALKSFGGSEEMVLVGAAHCCLTVGTNHPSYSMLQNVWESLATKFELRPDSSWCKDKELGLVILQDLLNSPFQQVLYSMCLGIEKLRKDKVDCKQMYMMAGYLARHCLPAIYRPDMMGKGFQPLVSCLLTPNQALSPTWNPTSEELKGISLCIPFFLRSMFAWPSIKSDKTFLRNINEIISIYVRQYRPSSNPLLFLFKRNEFSTSSPETKEFLVGTIVDQFRQLLMARAEAAPADPAESSGARWSGGSKPPSKKQKMSQPPVQIKPSSLYAMQVLSCSLEAIDPDYLSFFITNLLAPALEMSISLSSPDLKQESNDFIKSLLKQVFSQNQARLDDLQRLLNRELLDFCNTNLSKSFESVLVCVKMMVSRVPRVMDPVLPRLAPASVFSRKLQQEIITFKSMPDKKKQVLR